MNGSNAEAAVQVGGDLEAAGEDDAVDLVLDAVGDDPFAVMRSTPLVSDTSTRVTLGRLKVGKYSSLKQGRLHRKR